jgi:flagellar hook assembly protein FlgD
MVGDMSLTIDLNPDNDQPELHRFNNIYSHPFHVRPDGINPILDVTFDGKHIMNGDIVSPTPEILFEINDENPFLAVSDSAYEVFFGRKTPSGNLPRLFINGNSEMEVVPAELPENKGRLYFRPGQLDDGEYTLRVQGFDATGNAAGKTEYEINFEVVNESAVSNVLNYPNPFSSSTRWVYTLTGNELPEVFEIHIYTISGILVKVIDLHETNDVRFGRNISDYAWDGRDEFGDLLANGVYVYKVVTRLNGRQMDTRDEGVTDMFRNGFGKLYIMR